RGYSKRLGDPLQEGETMRTGRFQDSSPARHGELSALRKGLRWLAAALGMALLLGAPATAAQEGPRLVAPRDDGSTNKSSDSRWLPWLGCWELLDDGFDDRGEDRSCRSGQDLDSRNAGKRLVCLAPAADGRGVEITTLAGDAVLLEERLLADGVRHPVEEDGCRGWQATEWSLDGHRLFIRSKLDCGDNVTRSVSGLSMFVPRGRWVDIQVVGAGSQREVSIRRYRLADGEATWEAGIEGLPPKRSLAASTARAAAEAPLSTDDVVEATQKIDPEAVEAALLESDASFDLDSRALIRLAALDVPAGVIDLMIALSFPEHFVVDGYVGEERGAEHGGYAPFEGGGWPYAYGYPYFFAPFGYAYWISPYYYRPYFFAPTATRRPSGGRAIHGRGYTRMRTRDPSAGTTGRIAKSSRRRGSSVNGSGGLGGTGTSRGGGSGSSGGYTRGGASPGGRQAKPRSKN
ncbi:MAG: hypothetical protein ACE5JI_23100, partial [Acidobacteriota bacterium]